MPVSNFTEFLDTYDGNNVTFPETRAANLFNVDFRGVSIEFNSENISGTDYGAFVTDPAVTDQFVTGSISATAAGNMQFTTSVPILGLVLMKERLFPQLPTSLVALNVVWLL